ncbi:hypothetical protein ACQZ4Y_04030 [Rhizobium sp. L80/93]|uniref:hypothetical protein n=1 Tax=Rhizobium sp. E27B/91 TaxID=2819995 RepID=UPI001ADBF060|nr:hypothetical protein [Rhizobium sp. E27B/91]MBO9184587.1 hypothetical protein [Rhizobium sp. E27B/91]
MSQGEENLVRVKPIWKNGSLTLEVTYPSPALVDHKLIDQLADAAGCTRSANIWTPPTDGAASIAFAKSLSVIGLKLEYDWSPFNLEQLQLESVTRVRLETLERFELFHLSGWTPVQAEGTLDGRYFYFRARGSYWRFELGGNESGSRSPRWWYEEDWPSPTGFEAGYLSDEQAISCILKAVENYRTGDHSAFMPGHPDYERTIINGWSLGAIGLRTATIRLRTSGDAVIERAAAYGIDLPYTTQQELARFNSGKFTVHRRKSRTGTWSESSSEDDDEEPGS